MYEVTKLGVMFKTVEFGLRFGGVLWPFLKSLLNLNQLSNFIKGINKPSLFTTLSEHLLLSS